MPNRQHPHWFRTVGIGIRIGIGIGMDTLQAERAAYTPTHRDCDSCMGHLTRSVNFLSGSYSENEMGRDCICPTNLLIGEKL